MGTYSQEKPRGKVLYLLFYQTILEVVLSFKIKSQLETEPAVIAMTGWNTLTLNYPSSVNYKQQMYTAHFG